MRHDKYLWNSSCVFDVTFASEFDYAANLVTFFRISKFFPDKVWHRGGTEVPDSFVSRFNLSWKLSEFMGISAVYSAAVLYFLHLLSAHWNRKMIKGYRPRDPVQYTAIIDDRRGVGSSFHGCQG